MHDKSIGILNKAVADELSAVHQYMYFHFHLDDQGYGLLAALLKRVAIEEMGHIERLAERILFLGGDVEMVPSEPVEKIHDVKEMIERAREMERVSAIDYNKAALECANNADSQTKAIFEGLVGDEERHYDLYDKQIDNIERFGKRYLALQTMEEAEGEGAA